MPIISHPYHEDGTPHLTLERHSEVVSERVARLLRSLPAQQRRCGRVIGYLHDFGKATPQFQSYIHPAKDKLAVEDDRVFNHARLGALVAAHALSELDFSQLDIIAGILAIAKHHQALPNGADYLHNTLAPALSRSNTPVHAQIDGIADVWPAEADALLTAATESTVGWEDFVSDVADGTIAERLLSVSGRKLALTGEYQCEQDALPDDVYDRTLRYWSALTLADKSHAAALPEGDDTRLFGYDTLDRQPLDEHIARLQNTSAPPETARLNDWREAAREQTLAGIHEWLRVDDPPSIATLTLPTGLGKTFTGISAALTVRDSIQANHEGPPPVVIYALPYTSIIEQTRDHFEDPDIWGASTTGGAFTVHHYLSETVVASRDEAEPGADAAFLGESWRSGVVLTTFVQLFESLVGPSNEASTKLPALDNAVVVLDEPQALPKTWWDGIRRTTELLANEFDSRVISMTATQPALFDSIPTTSLLSAGARHTATDCQRCTRSSVPSHERREYFENAKRVTYHLDDSALAHRTDSTADYVSHRAAADRLVSKATETNAGILAVCNTIASSRRLTECIVNSCAETRHIGAVYEDLLKQGEITTGDNPANTAERVLESCGFETAGELSWLGDDRPPVFVGTFNSRYRPADRQSLLSTAEQLATATVPFVFVSTQAIEAGVDISFSDVYRDIAPLDSIVQAAGRCNRSFEWGAQAGSVTVWTLASPDEPAATDPGEMCPAKSVYAREIDDHLTVISETLASVADDPSTPIPDDKFAYDGVIEYFDRLAQKSVATPEIREEMDDCLAVRLQRRSLIQDYETVDVLVGVTDEDCRRIEAVGRAYTDGDQQRAYNLLSDCADLRVSVPVRGQKGRLRSIPRVDHQTHDTEDGIQVLAFTGSGGEYELSSGGFDIRDDLVTDRFTV